MGANINGFDASKVKPDEGRPAPLPEGRYRLAATASEWKDTKNKKGKYIAWTFTVLEGPFKGRKIFEQMNLQNPSQQASDIAKGQLSALCHAVGVMKPKDAAELQDIPFWAQVGCKKDEGYDMRNVIKKYEKRGEQTADAPGAAEPGDAPPWAA